MAGPPRRATRKGKQVTFFSTVTLAAWQLRRTWRLLLVTGAGVLAAVIFVCAVPIYIQVSTTAELRTFLNANPANGVASNSDVVVHAVARQVSPTALASAQKQIDQEVQKDLGPYITAPAQFTFEVDNLNLLQPEQDAQGNISYKNQGNQLTLYSTAMSQATSHLRLLAGRLPNPNSKDIEIALTSSEAQGFHLVPGSLLQVNIPFDTAFSVRQATLPVYLHVVGIFAPIAGPFWHSQDFSCAPLSLSTEVCTVLASSDGLVNALSNATSGPPFSRLFLEAPPNAQWYYHMEPSRIDSINLGNVQNGLSTALVNISHNPIISPYVEQTESYSAAANAISTYSTRNSVAQIPVMSLLFMVVGLTLFFVSMMTDIIVDRQAEAMTILRSRGASRLHIFSSLLIQSIGLGIVALIVGPLLAVGTVQLVALRAFSPADQGALNILTLEPSSIAQSSLISSAMIVVIAILAMALSISGVVRLNVLSMRREYARSTFKPLWQRFNLDSVAAVIALTGYGFSVYETGPGVLDVRVRALLLPPLTLVGVVFLLIAVTLLFLRLFPALLRVGSWFAVRGRSAAPMLAMAQMARSPRQSLRMTTLLAFSLAFAIFTMVFTASQAQRVVDFANYEVGADFSGKLPGSATIASSSTYRRLPGIQSATVGYTSLPRAAQNGLDLTVQLQAVDANTYAQTMIWPAQNNAQPISALMQQLVARRGQVVNTNVVPAIVDAVGWQTLHLFPGATFSITDLNGSVNCIAVAEVERIPTVNDSAQATGTNDFNSYGGILVDYQSYSSVVTRVNNVVPVTTDVWLRSGADASSEAKARAALTTGGYHLDALNDRRAIIANLDNDPLYLGLVGVLFLGAAVALLLALAGNLIASWLSVRSRLTSFAVLRALGAAPPQIAGTIAWEQSIVYATAIVLGTIFGVLLSVLALPTLIFTNVAASGFQSGAASGEFFILQSVPPIQVVVPASLLIIFALVVALCIVALGMMIRVASRPSISQALRLNED